MKISMFPDGSGSCTYWRLKLPASRLKHDIKITTLMNQYTTNKDIIVIERATKPDVFENAIFAREIRNAKIIYELDDDIFNIPKTNGCIYSENQLYNAVQFIKYADAVTVSTDHLAKVIRAISKDTPIYVLPNSIDFVETDKILEKKSLSKWDNKIRIGWAGSATHMADIARPLLAIASVLRKNPNVVFKIIGFSELFKFTPIAKLFKGLESQIEVVGWCPLDRYPYNVIDFDIGICPLLDIPFNRSKSNLKWLEYSAYKIPTIASSVEPYKKSIIHGKTGLLVTQDQNQWERYLQQLINSRVMRNTLAENAYKHVKENYNIDKNVILWEKCYSEVLNADKKQAIA